MSYKQLADKYHCSIKTIQRYIDKVLKTSLPIHKTLILILLLIPRSLDDSLVF